MQERYKVLLAALCMTLSLSFAFTRIVNPADSSAGEIDVRHVDRSGSPRSDEPLRSPEPLRSGDELEREPAVAPETTGPLETPAIELSLVADALASCARAKSLPTRTGVVFRQDGTTMGGASLRRIDELVDTWRTCGDGVFLVRTNPQGDLDGDPSLRLRREQEVKYYLLQRRVPKADIELEIPQ